MTNKSQNIPRNGFPSNIVALTETIQRIIIDIIKIKNPFLILISYCKIKKEERWQRYYTITTNKAVWATTIKCRGLANTLSQDAQQQSVWVSLVLRCAFQVLPVEYNNYCARPMSRSWEARHQTYDRSSKY